MLMKKPELLIPAGSLENLYIAVAYGADAIYIGGEQFGLRAKAKNFSKEQMVEGRPKKKRPRKRKRNIPQPIRKNNHVDTTLKNKPAKYIPKTSAPPKPVSKANQPEAGPPRAEKPEKGKEGEFKFEELKAGEIEINLD